MQNEEEPEVSQFDYCKKVDLHAVEPETNLESVVSIAAEHGFRGNVVTPSRAEALTWILKEQNSTEILPICVIDYPDGSMSLDIRNYCILSAKEKGIKEVELVAPNHLLADRDFNRIFDDAKGCMATAKKAGISLKYILDQDNRLVDEDSRLKMAKIIDSAGIPIVSTSLGFTYKKNADHSDHIIKMRKLKSKGRCEIKVYISLPDVSDIASYVKAGADVIGLPWNKAANLVHAYENMVEDKG